jgi:hypothetical protein
VEPGVPSFLKKRIESQQAARLSHFLLPINFLKAENIGIEPEELRPHQGNALFQRRTLAWLIIKIF